MLRIVLALALTSVAGAEETSTWLTEQYSQTPKTGPPVFSEEEWNALPTERGLDYQFQDRHGVPTPRVNGRGILGVEYRFGANSLAQMESDLRLLSYLGVNAIRGAIRSVPAEGGDPAQVATWRAKADLCRRYGLAVWPDLGGQGYFDAILQDLYDHVLRQPMPPAFVAGRGVAALGDHYGDAHNPDYVSAHAQVLAELMKAVGPDSVVGYCYSDEPGWGPTTVVTPSAADDWRSFLKRLYRDDAPAGDTNGDGVTFNEVWEMDYGTWEAVEQFTGEEMQRDPRKKALAQMWTDWAHARFIDALSARMQQVDPRASVSEAYIHEQGVSLLNAMPHNRTIGFGNYGDVARTCEYVAAAHAYNKPGFTFHITRGWSNYFGARSIGVPSLPFCPDMLWWHFTTGCNDGQAEDYGRNYALANWWTFNSHIPKDWPTVNRIVEFDPRFLLMVQIAPFVGRFDSMPAELANAVLWISPPVPQLVRNNHLVTEPALVLGDTERHGVRSQIADCRLPIADLPDSGLRNPKSEIRGVRSLLDLDRYRLIIFAPGRGAFFAETRALLDGYVRRGGTVLVDLPRVGRGRTLIGQSNRDLWLADFDVGRADPTASLEAAEGEIAVLYQDDYATPDRWRQDRADWQGPCTLWSPNFPGFLGAYPDGAEGSFTYRFEVPPQFAAVRLRDTHAVWGRQNVVILSLSTDGENWQEVHHDAPQDVSHYQFERLFRIDEDLQGRRTLHLRYYFRAGDPGRTPQDNRGACLSRFELAGVTPRGLEMLAAWVGDHETAVQIDDRTARFPNLEGYVRPKAGVEIQALGRVTDDQGAERALLYVVPHGQGRWLYLNSPSVFSLKQPGDRDFDPRDWEVRWSLLAHLIHGYTEGRLEDYRQPYISQGEGCLMASLWEYAPPVNDYPIRFTSEHGRVVVFEALDGTLEGGPFVEVREGVGTFTRSFARQESHVWVLKPYGRPILLTADGSVRSPLCIDDGIWEDRRLTFEFADQARVSSPERPLRVTVAGQPRDFEYDADRDLLTIQGTGRAGRCVVEY